MVDLATLNGSPAPYRRDLRGEDLVYELLMLLDRLEPGDTLRISYGGMIEAGVAFADVLAPAYPHKRWRELPSGDICVTRTG